MVEGPPGDLLRRTSLAYFGTVSGDAPPLLTRHWSPPSSDMACEKPKLASNIETVSDSQWLFPLWCLIEGATITFAAETTVVLLCVLRSIPVTTILVVVDTIDG